LFLRNIKNRPIDEIMNIIQANNTKIYSESRGIKIKSAAISISNCRKKNNKGHDAAIRCSPVIISFTKNSRYEKWISY